MVWQPNILNNSYELSGGYASPKPPTRGSAPPGPRWGTSVPQTPCAPPATSKSWLRHCHTWTVVFIMMAAAIYSLGHGLRTFTAVPRSTQPSTLRGTVK